MQASSVAFEQNCLEQSETVQVPRAYAAHGSGRRVAAQPRAAAGDYQGDVAKDVRRAQALARLRCCMYYGAHGREILADFVFEIEEIGRLQPPAFWSSSAGADILRGSAKGMHGAAAPPDRVEG